MLLDELGDAIGVAHVELVIVDPSAQLGEGRQVGTDLPIGEQAPVGGLYLGWGGRSPARAAEVEPNRAASAIRNALGSVIPAVSGASPSSGALERPTMTIVGWQRRAISRATPP